MRNLLTLLLVLAVCAQAGLLYLGYQRQETLEAMLTAQVQQIDQLRSELEQQQLLIANLEQESVGAMVKKANEVIVDGWGAIANSIESELEKARSALQQLNEAPQ